MSETSMSCPKCGGVAEHAEWCRDVSTMPGDEPASRWPSDTFDAGDPYPEDVPKCAEERCAGDAWFFCSLEKGHAGGHRWWKVRRTAPESEPCATCGGSGNAPCLTCGDVRLTSTGDECPTCCDECDPPLPCPDCDEQLISERNHEKRCACARLEQG